MRTSVMWPFPLRQQLSNMAVYNMATIANQY